MSLGDDAARKTAMRATAHPLRLRIMSLLTGAAMTAAEVARELGVTHANASYHLRSLASAGLIVPAGEERIRGGVAKRYRYDVARERDDGPPRTREQNQTMFIGLANELIRRVSIAQFGGGGVYTDAELWVEPAVWRDAVDRVLRASRDLHLAARPPRTPGTVRTSTSLAMFAMETEPA